MTLYKEHNSGEEVVISGMSGLFPSSDSVQEFMENLYNKVDMVTTENPRWVYNHPEMPNHLGQVNNMGKFDAQFFRVHYKQALTMEPMSRKLLEHAYSAIYDSGINPLQLRGKKVGVFIGSTFSESEKIVIYENIQRNGFGITGCNKSMYANRISYWIDGKGPSYSLDLACSSSMACLEHAFRSINSGQCDAAIVGGCNLCMHPNVSLNFRRAGFACLDGKTKCFDKNSDGYVRSDAIGVLFLQRAKDAKRIYSEVYHAKLSYSLASELLLPMREPKELQKFLEAFYSEIGVSPADVEYIEANGAAIPNADFNELKAIAEVYGKEKPIKVGCVKSNMGSSEPASGICGLTKVCLAFHNGKLSGNLHYNDPLDLPELKNNKIQVLTDNAEFGRGFAALNSFSYSGANVHVLLKGHYKQKDLERYKTSVPRLILLSGRQDDCVQKMLDNIKTSTIDPEQIGLLHNIHQFDIPGHMSRGFSIIDSNEKKETVCLSQSVEYFPGKTGPVWFVYSGMGSQWATMGAELMRIPIFAAAIQKCDKVLKLKGLDIVEILSKPDKTIYDNILHSFVGIAAVQIGLTDILNEMGIIPDNIIGHSVGELGCAYADGCFTAEEMILSAYSRGLVSVQTPLIRGSMAAVGLGYKNVLPLCPPEIEVACHNSSESSTISGPAEVMKQFISELTSLNVFAKEVPCSNIPYHSRYIAKAGPDLLKYLSEVIKNPKARSAKWLSTSVPQDKWNEPIAKYSSAEYHTNNLLNSVLFEETSKLIPSDAIVIEVAPHGLLQAILKRSLPDCIHVPLTKRGSGDPVKFFLESIGKIYQAGLNPKIDVLYPKIEFPVSTGTPFLSHLVEWEHSEDWSEAKYNKKEKVIATQRDLVMSISDEEYKYFTGHVRDGNCVFPESAYLVIVWETFAMYKGVNYRDMSVVFRNVQFYGEALINPQLPLHLNVMIMKGNNKFEITYEESTIVSGYVTELKSKYRPVRDVKNNENGVCLNAQDIYTIMRMKGYDYKHEFQSIRSSSSNRSKASIQYTENWITLLDSLLQFNAFARDYDGTSVPLLINELVINVTHHLNAEKVLVDKVTCINANLLSVLGHTKCGGIEIDGITFKDNPVVEQISDVLLTQTFVPHFVNQKNPIKTAVQVNLQIVAENNTNDTVKVFDLASDKVCGLYEVIKEAASEIVTHEFEMTRTNDENMQSLKDADVLIIDNVLVNQKKMNDVYNILRYNSFVIALEKENIEVPLDFKLFKVITKTHVNNHVFVLLKKNKTCADENIIYMPIVQDSKFLWIHQLEAELKESRKVILISEKQPHSGLIETVKKLRQHYGNKIGLMIVDDANAPSFNPLKDIFKHQLEKNLAFNVLNKGQWGGYYNISSDAKQKIENIYLTCTRPGNIESLMWANVIPSPSSKSLVQVYYAGISTIDANAAVGKTNTDTHKFGMEYSGISSSGEKVMGVVSGGALASNVEPDPELLWPVPEYWTLEDAATVPLAYAQAYYCLAIKYRLRRGATVLITSGAEALGQALITLSLSLHCKVFVTVSDVKQKNYIKQLFPSLKDTQIGLPEMMLNKIVFSENNDTRINIQDSTQIPLCDVIINCLSGSPRKALLNCLCYNGTFIDTCPYDMSKNEEFGIRFLYKATSYMAVHFNTVFKPEFANVKKLIQAQMCEGIAKGIVRPLSRLVYPAADITRGFRLVTSNKNVGNILIRMDLPQDNDQTLRTTARMSYSPKGSYVVICDGTELSIELADRLVQRGARNLVIHMTPTPIAGYCYTKFLSWEKLNVSQMISSENLQSKNGCKNLLNEGAKLGPIRGIFIVQNLSSRTEVRSSKYAASKLNDNATVVANLDFMSRNLCSELEHFVILHYSNQKVLDDCVNPATDEICRSRNEMGLPALVFCAGPVTELEDAENRKSKMEQQPLSAMFNALETGLKLKHNNMIAYNVKKNDASGFLQKISRIIGVKNIHELDENLTLKDLLLNGINVEEIQVIIKNTYHISYPLEKLEKTRIKSLKTLGSSMLEAESSKNSGLGAFFTYIDQDECAAAEPIVTMATSYGIAKEEENLDPYDTYVMLVPGFEGHHQIFTTISERLKVQAMTFQLAPDMANESIADIAVNILKFTKNRLKIKTKFYLLGYSFGVNVALELARIFEQEGHIGVVYCLDSSPDALRAQLEAYVGNLTDSQLQNVIIKHMYKLMAGRDFLELKQELEALENWNEKVELCVNKVRGLVKYSHQYKRCLLNSAYKRIVLAKEYEPNFVLQSELVLIRGPSSQNIKQLPEDFNLSKYTTKPVKVFNIQSDHASAHQDCRVSNIVNRLLEPKLLEEYEMKNLLWTYLADPVKTW